MYLLTVADGQCAQQVEDRSADVNAARAALRQDAATLSIRDIRQGGAENRQLLVSYVAATYDDGATNLIEWRIGDSDGGFPHSAAVDPRGNAPWPFADGSRVQLRTRVNNSNGTTAGSVRTIAIV